jgi:hypothetical protein
MLTIDDLNKYKTGSAHTLGSTACRTSCVVSPGETDPVSATFSGVLTWMFKYSEQAIAIAKTIFSNILAAPPLPTFCDLLYCALHFYYVTSSFDNCNLNH